jgi:pyruvate formate lyase activating enzyme
VTVRGLVTDTITFSNVDGPGNRFVVFLQGCNFDCVACHNPYTINVCTDCGECIATCPSGALSLVDGLMVWDAQMCTGGDTCLAVCPYDASPKARTLEVDDLLVGIRRAAPFLSGITVSGGEATQQAPFVHDLFAAVRADPALARLTCFVDSNGSTDPATWHLLAPVMDGAMIDLKCLDPDIHQHMTGMSNEPVLASIRQLHSMGLLYEVRLLLLAGVNDDPALLHRTAEWLASVDPTMRVKLIGFRHHGARPHDPPLVEPTTGSLDAAASILADVSPFDICVI